MLHIRRRVRFFFSAMAACLTLSWRTSPTYTVLRLTSNLVPPILTLISSVLGKYVLDLLSGSFRQDNQIALLIMLSVGICISAIGVSAIQKAQTYMQSMHDELINKELALFMMDRAGTADCLPSLEYALRNQRGIYGVDCRVSIGPVKCSLLYFDHCRRHSILDCLSKVHETAL